MLLCFVTFGSFHTRLLKSQISSAQAKIETPIIKKNQRQGNKSTNEGMQRKRTPEYRITKVSLHMVESTALRQNGE